MFVMRVLFFLLEVLFFFLVAACLLRAWMNQLRVNMSAQPGRFAMAITDWLVQPLRRMLPRSVMRSRIDWGSLLAGVLLALAYGLLWWLLASATGSPMAALPVVISMAMRLLLRVVLQGLMLVLLGYALLSWLQPQSPAMGLLERLCAPILVPVRRIIPTVGGVDLSVLVLLVLLQVGLMLLA